MNRNRHTRHYNHTRGNRVGIKELFGGKKQIIGFGGKEELKKEELLSVANTIIEKLEKNTLSLENVRGHAKLLIDDWKEAEDI